MTTASHRKAILEQIAHDIRRCSEMPARAAHYEESVWQTWEQLVKDGYWSRARQWWLDEIHPTFCTAVEEHPYGI